MPEASGRMFPNTSVSSHNVFFFETLFCFHSHVFLQNRVLTKCNIPGPKMREIQRMLKILGEEGFF